MNTGARGYKPTYKPTYEPISVIAPTLIQPKKSVGVGGLLLTKRVNDNRTRVIKPTPVDVNTRLYLNKHISTIGTTTTLSTGPLGSQVIWDPDYFKNQCGAINTREARQRAWSKWGKFLNGSNAKICNDTFERYAVWRFATGTVSSDSISAELSHINHKLHDKGVGLNRMTEAVGTRHVLDGIKRTQFALFGICNGKQARALTDKLCDAFVDISNENDGNIMLVCKHAVLRSDNVCVNKNRHHLCAKHVRVVKENDEEIVILDLPGSKTNQFCIPEERVLYHRKEMCNGGQILSDMCPACVCIKLSNVRSVKRAPNDALFVRVNGTPYSYNHLNKLVKRCAEYFDLDPALYTTHCLRRGGATDLFIKYGKSLDWIMVHCNWESKETVMKRYLKAHNPDLDAPLIKLYWLRR